MKKYFILLFLLTSLTSQAQTLHLIVVSDYADRDFGPINVRDEDIVRQMFSKIARRIDYTFTTVYVNNKQRKGFTKQAVLDALKLTLTQPNDIVVFHYAGKGIYARGSISPSLKLDKPLLLDDIANVLQNKKLRLGMVMADCRNEFTDRYPIAGLRGTIIEEEQSKKITKKLFLENDCRVVKIASGRRDADFLSFKNSSVFNYSLTETYEDMLYTEDMNKVNLDNFIREIEQTTKDFIPSYQGLREESAKCK